MARPVRDRIAELIRGSRIPGGAGREYERQPDTVKDDYRKSADWLVANAGPLGIRIVDERSTQCAERN